jgi:hypothetical protein
MVSLIKSKLIKDGEFLANLMNFTRFDWLQQQSFCYGRQSKLKTVERLTQKGHCFTFNGNDQLIEEDR